MSQRRGVRAREPEQFGVPDTYTDWRALLDCKDIDAVDICTPNQVRKEPAIAACEAGKHVLVQKPMAPTLEDATATIEAARRNKVKLGVIFMGRFDPGNALIIRLVRAGRASLEIILVGYESAAAERFVHLKYQTW